MTFLNFIWFLVQFLLGYHLVVPLILHISQLFRKRPGLDIKGNQAGPADYGIIVTAYEDTSNLNNVVQCLQDLHYANFHIYIVADKCDVSSFKLDDDRLSILKPEVVLQSNIKSHFYAINRFVRPHARLTIIDSDNLVDPEYLNELNKWFDRGFEAVQGIRLPKNLDTSIACLDAARDIYYHYYDGQLLFSAGSSATLSGSGMAFTTSLYRACLEHLDIQGAGFDKVLQAEVVKKGKRIAFAPEAKVFDEKTSRNDQLVDQRARWINTWFRYFNYGFKLIGKGLRRLNANQLLFGLILLRPPLFMFLILSFLFMVGNFWINPVACFIWIIAFSFFFIAFGIALGRSGADKRIYGSLKNIPLFMFYQVRSLFRIRNANERSVVTKHYYKKN